MFLPQKKLHYYFKFEASFYKKSIYKTTTSMFLNGFAKFKTNNTYKLITRKF